MIYRGHEKENHRGSKVRFFHAGKWHEGTLLEPVNYQIVVTREYPPVVLSCAKSQVPYGSELGGAMNHVATGNYTQADLDILARNLDTPLCAETESVQITDANLINQEEADKILAEYKEKYLK